MDPELLELLLALDGVRQSPVYHPEGDALFHSLQVFDHARRSTQDPELWAAALFHDLGKGLRDLGDHDEVGADLLDGLVSDRVVWLVRHHLDLLRDPRRTRRNFHGTRALADLEALRRWDLAGRRRDACVMEADQAFALVCQRLAESHREPFAPERNDT